ncbi:helix-turn-helix domain-containing protein, partial [Pseudomonas lactis]|uniref:helix-turn-helix domain-containing protein n=1 Tax=Pseudomonas lactis TaxID=1615674 RepID=UPI001F1C476A
LTAPDPSLASGAACVALNGDAEGLGQLFEALCSEINTERAGRAAALDSLTRLIMIRLLRLCAHAQPARPTAHEDLRIFHRFNELIEAHYLEHWPLARYAESIGVTQARLNEVCRRIADLPSKRLILERLMQEAKRLLLFTGSSANEICYQLGFKDPAYFSRFFLRYAQMTPGEYRIRQAGMR